MHTQAYEILCKSLGAGHPNAAYVMCGKVTHIWLICSRLTYRHCCHSLHPHEGPPANSTFRAQAMVLMQEGSFEPAMELFKKALQVTGVRVPEDPCAHRHPHHQTPMSLAHRFTKLLLVATIRTQRTPSAGWARCSTAFSHSLTDHAVSHS